MALLGELGGNPPRTLEISLPWGVSTELNVAQSKLVGALFFKTFVCFAFALMLDKLLHSRCKAVVALREEEQAALEELQQQEVAVDQVRRFINLLVDEAGIDFTSAHGLSGIEAIDQDYAEQIREAVTLATRIDLISIAGYQAVGRKNRSLFYDLLRNNRKAVIRVMLLDPEKGSKVIQSRAKNLRDTAPAKINEEIGQTISTLRELAESRRSHEGEISYGLLWRHPAFRMLITDDTAFISAYMEGRHGHESPVLVFRKSGHDGPKGSFYEAFATLFEVRWETCEKFSLPFGADS